MIDSLTVTVTQSNRKKIVTIPVTSKLTPKIARLALGWAFGNDYKGVVWDSAAGYGYQVYPHTARKIHTEENDT